MALENWVNVVQVDTVANVKSSPVPAKLLAGLTQGVAVANGAVPFADLTAASNKVNELLASLRAAGIIAT